ncbi:(R)-2-hydroxyisocaproyl-CoA dehydratase alpha subunit [Eubacterium plexicaudatum ASF492]|uniref:Benzoyl-CoA reductase, subunit B n=1 Tax=Eubacterium plexicaudatum ASF492 TaxID=1235802 RepID=N2AMT6_9FIRM|nr:(R)-2-hydroxyisocaproyl-CoA dehydratase alpha subunit [Eubacterium plexicaudatum ASF492]
MEQSMIRLQAQLMKDYYKDFSRYAKGKKPECKIAWVTAFTPVEILEALGMDYYYPESYAAVIAASGKEQELMQECERQHLTADCCSYSCCFEGCVSLEKGPRGIPPKPDVLIATNNQCNTLPNWWNILAQRYHVPLIILDYPGEYVSGDYAYDYVRKQHEDLIFKLEILSGNKLDMSVLDKMIRNSKNSVQAWERIVDEFAVRAIRPTELFDGISFLITARCKEETAQLYVLMQEEFQKYSMADLTLTPVFWLGYPLWYHKDRYLSEIFDGFRMVGSNYITWWNLDYSGDTPLERLFQAYNYTFLNLKQNSRTKKLMECIKRSKAAGTVTLRNKSCKCDFVSARNIGLPQAELEIDMIDRMYLDTGKARRQMELLKEAICIVSELI